MALLAGAIEPSGLLEEFAADLAPDLRDFLLWAAKLPDVVSAIDALLLSALGVILAMTGFFAVFFPRRAVSEAVLADLRVGFVDDLAVITFFLLIVPFAVPAILDAFFLARIADFFAPAFLPGLSLFLPEALVLEVAVDFPVDLPVTGVLAVLSTLLRLPPVDFFAGDLRAAEPLRLA